MVYCIDSNCGYEAQDISLKPVKAVKVGDIVRHNNKLMTVGHNSLLLCQFMGHMLFGDNYRGGARLVEVIDVTGMSSRAIAVSNRNHMGV